MDDETVLNPVSWSRLWMQPGRASFLLGRLFLRNDRLTNGDSGEMVQYVKEKLSLCLFAQVCDLGQVSPVLPSVKWRQ